MIEWCTTSSFSFTEGVSSPEELINQAGACGYAGLAMADRMGLYGLVQGLRAMEMLIAEDEEIIPFASSAFEGGPRPRSFFYAPGIRLHFDAADPLFVYPLHKAAHGRLCRYLTEWALGGMAGTNGEVGEKGLSPLPWGRFRDFLRAQPDLKRDFILISVSGRFFPWPENSPEKQVSRLQTQDIKKTTPTFCNPPTAPGQCPFWLLELAEICGRGAESALSLAYPLTLAPGAQELNSWLREQSESLQIPLLATSLPLYATQEERPLCDVVTCIRHNLKIEDLGYLKQANGERRFLSFTEREVFRRQIPILRPGFDPFERGYHLSKRHHFSLRELKYKYPSERIPAGYDSPSWLRHLTYQGAGKRYPEGLPKQARDQIEHELDLIRRLGYEDYFLTIWDVLEFARKEQILYQGRGSAANSIICYCLEITSIDPSKMDLLFERFLSMERREPPDIDVDFEHERREEVMQNVYTRYGRERAAMVASVVCFRHRMAVRECAKVLGFKLEHIDTLISFMGREGFSRLSRISSTEESPTTIELKKFLAKEQIRETRWQLLLELVPQIVGLPRHVGLHTGGFVLSNERLDELCILEPARMEKRSIVPWDKDDVDYLGWMKVDLLSLGMLTAIRKTFDYMRDIDPNDRMELATVPDECPIVYRNIRRADTVGIFQIESRAQMNMLPRLQPRTFYDLVIEVAIVRPGPLQGGMVHPFLRRRQNKEKPTYDHPKLIPILERTLGVPIFQEQVMKIAVAIGGFTHGESDQLRKVMSGAWRSKSSMHKLKEKLVNGMRAENVKEEFIERLYKQIEGFGEYGFPESHAASFAKLTYVSSWMKFHRPSQFLCALLNSQPMGFYSTRALINDSERHGVPVLPVDVLFSKWDCYVEPNSQKPHSPYVRLGLRLIKGFSQKEALQIEELQARGIFSPEHEELPSFATLRSLGIEQKTLEKLTEANAFRNFASEAKPTQAKVTPLIDPRRSQHWELLKLRHASNQPTLDLGEKADDRQFLKNLDEWQSILKDYRATGSRTQLGHEYFHPVHYARTHFFTDRNWTTAEGLYLKPGRSRVHILGLLGIKQKPPTAGGLCFLTLEDESGFMNLTLMPDIYEKYRLVVDFGVLLAATGTIEKSDRSDPRDPHSAAVALRIEHMWAPFSDGSFEIGTRVRAYH